jgi:hypothetical protein
MEQNQNRHRPTDLPAFASSDWFLSLFNADELSDMGVQKR